MHPFRRAIAAAVTLALPAVAQSVPAIVEAHQTLVVKAQVPGQIARLGCDVGDAVKGLDVLAVIGNPELSAELGVHDLEMARRQAQLDSLGEAAKVAGIDKKLAERATKSAGAELPIARQRLELAQQHTATLKVMFESGRLTAADYSQAQLALAAAETSVRAAERAVLDAQDQQAIAEARLQQATQAVAAQRSWLDAARAARDGVDVRLRQCEVKCVLAAAKVNRVFVGRGDVVAIGDRLVELVDVTRLRVVLRLPPGVAAHTAAGTRVRLSTAGQEDCVPGATVTRLGAVVEGDGCLPAIVEIAAAPGLFPGQELRAELLPAAGK